MVDLVPQVETLTCREATFRVRSLETSSGTNHRRMFHVKRIHLYGRLNTSQISQGSRDV